MVEASETGRRIFWRHRWLLLILLILPAAGVVALREHQPVMYAAAAAIQGQGTTPDASTQVSAIQSRVTAVATDPALVQTAIRQAKAGRNAVQVARHQISVAPLGSSAIMVMTVTDRSPRVAVALAGSLATAVVNELNELGVKGNPELASLSRTNTALTARRGQLLAELNTAGNSNASTSVQVQSLLSQLAATEQELAANQSQAQQVLATVTTEMGASVVSVPASATGASRHAAVDGALAALLGLVLGLLFAALREVVRPTVAQPAAGARELGAVLLGRADARRDRIVRLEADLPQRLSLVAHRAGALTIVLTGPGSPARLSALAARLHDELPAPEPAAARAARVRTAVRTDHGQTAEDPGPNGDARRPVLTAARPAKPQRTVITLADVELGAAPPDAALVVVLPAFAPHGALDQAADLGVTTGWPILGVIAIRGLRGPAALPGAKDPHLPEAPAAGPGQEASDVIDTEGEDD